MGSRIWLPFNIFRNCSIYKHTDITFDIYNEAIQYESVVILMV